MRGIRYAALAALLAVGVAGCDSDGITIEDQNFQVRLAAESGAAAISGAIPAVVEPDVIASILISIDAVEVLPAEGDEEDDAAWIRLDVAGEEAMEIDFSDLPSQGGITLVDSEATPGEFQALRLRIAGTSLITFTQDVMVGQSLYEGGVEQELTIPSGPQTGIKLEADFTIGEDDVLIVFDESTSAGNIIATGANRVMMTPVLRVETEPMGES